MGKLCSFSQAGVVAPDYALVFHRRDTILYGWARQTDLFSNGGGRQSGIVLQQREDALICPIHFHGINCMWQAISFDPQADIQRLAVLSDHITTERAMRKISPETFTGSHAWAAMDIERFTGATTVRLHWTDEPYKWHINDGPEVFVVLDGAVDMHTREDGKETVHKMKAGEVFHAREGDEHVAHPRGAARVLVIETEGSV